MGDLYDWFLGSDCTTFGWFCDPTASNLYRGVLWRTLLFDRAVLGEGMAEKDLLSVLSLCVFSAIRRTDYLDYIPAEDASHHFVGLV